MDRGVWCSAVYGVTQSQTQLKRLNSIYIYIYNLHDKLWLSVTVLGQKHQNTTVFGQRPSRSQTGRQVMCRVQRKLTCKGKIPFFSLICQQEINNPSPSRRSQ